GDTGLPHPVKRGRIIAMRAMCQSVPPPPPNVPPPPNPVKTTTNRQRYEATHDKVSPCSNCHSVMDPPGFAFENYDAVGAYTTMDTVAPTYPVDASGSIALSRASDAPVIKFHDGIDLMNQIGGREEILRCAMSNWF